MGVPIIRTIVYWDLYGGTLILGNYHLIRGLVAMRSHAPLGYCVDLGSSAQTSSNSRHGTSDEDPEGSKCLPLAERTYNEWSPAMLERYDCCCCCHQGSICSLSNGIYHMLQWYTQGSAWQLETDFAFMDAPPRTTGNLIF